MFRHDPYRFVARLGRLHVHRTGVRPGPVHDVLELFGLRLRREEQRGGGGERRPIRGVGRGGRARMAQRRRARDAAQQEHDGCVDGVRESAVSVRVQQLGVGCTRFSGFLPMGVAAAMDAFVLMEQRNVGDFAERIQQRRRAQACLLVSL